MTISLRSSSPSPVAWDGSGPLEVPVPTVVAGDQLVLVVSRTQSEATPPNVVDNLGTWWEGRGSWTPGAWPYLTAYTRRAVGGETTVTVGDRAGFDGPGVVYCMVWTGARPIDVYHSSWVDSSAGTGYAVSGIWTLPVAAGSVVVHATALAPAPSFVSSTLTVPGVTLGARTSLVDAVAGAGPDMRLLVDWSNAVSGVATPERPSLTGTLDAAGVGQTLLVQLVESAPPGLPPDRFRVRVDWTGDGDYSDPVEDVTGDVRAVRSAVSLRYGREPGGDSSTVAGSGGLTLDNRDRRYSARNTTSPLYGLIRPGRPVQIDRTIGGTTYTLFRGRTGDAPLNPDIEGRTVAPELVDTLGDLRGTTISTTVERGMRTGQAIGLILDYAGWAGGRDLDPGATVIPWWWEDGTDVLTALDKVVRSEGFPALLTVGPAGEVVFRDRYHRILRSGSNTSRGVWRPSGSIQPVMARGAVVDDGWAGIVNRASLTVDTRTAGLPEAVWQPDTPIIMARFETRTVPFSTSDPFIDAYASTGGWSDPNFPSVSFSLSRTSGTSAILTIQSGSAATSALRLRLDSENLSVVAKPVRVVTSTVVSAADAVSQGAYGVREWRGDLPWCGVEDAQSLVTQMVADRKDPLPVVTCRFLVGRDKARAAALLSRDLSDRVTIVEPESVLNDDFHIESIEHTFSGEADHEVQFTSEHVPPATGPLFLVGSSLLDGTDELGW